MHDGSGSIVPVFSGARRATLSGLDADGQALIALDCGRTVPADTLVPLSAAQIGQGVLWCPLEDNAGGAVILGLFQTPGLDKVGAAPAENQKGAQPELNLVSDRQITLRCGEASITLFPDGRIALRGTQILSRAEGANRVQGGCVLLN